MQNLFYGTHYEEKFISPIFQDITNVMKYYPKLKPERVTTGTYPYVHLSGQINYVMQNISVEIPLNIILPDAFPKCEPIVQIFAPQGFQFSPIGIQSNGVLPTQNIYPWQFTKSTLPLLVSAISNFFSTYSPTTYQGLQYLNQMFQQMKAQQQYNQSPPGSNNSQMDINQCYSLLQSECTQTITDANNSQNKLYSLQAENAMLKNMDEMVTNKLNEITNSNNAIKSGMGGSGYIIPNEMQQQALEASKEKASLETIQYLHVLLKDQQITPQQFLEMTRKMSRKHFNDYVYPRLL